MDNLNSIQQAAKEQFDRRSHCYGQGHILKNVEDVKHALQFITPPTINSKALDVATGAGHTGLFLAEQGYQVTLNDLSPAMLEQAKKTAQERGLMVQTQLHAAEKFPYQSETFDLVTCRVAAHHFSSPFDFIQETSRVLKSNGFLY